MFRDYIPDYSIRPNPPKFLDKKWFEMWWDFVWEYENWILAVNPRPYSRTRDHMTLRKKKWSNEVLAHLELKKIYLDYPTYTKIENWKQKKSRPQQEHIHFILSI